MKAKASLSNEVCAFFQDQSWGKNAWDPVYISNTSNSIQLISTMTHHFWQREEKVICLHSGFWATINKCRGPVFLLGNFNHSSWCNALQKKNHPITEPATKHQPCFGGRCLSVMGHKSFWFGLKFWGVILNTHKKRTLVTECIVG